MHNFNYPHHGTNTRTHPHNPTIPPSRHLDTRQPATHPPPHPATLPTLTTLTTPTTPPPPDSTDLYLFLVLGINLPWTIFCCRQYVVVPDTPFTRRFAIIYDLAVGRPFFRNHVLLMVWSVQGFQNSSYFTLMLLDIINNR